MSELTDEIEKQNFQRIVHAFSCYRKHSLNKAHRTENYLKTLPRHHVELLQKYKQHLQNVKLCIEQNYSIIKLILRDVGYLFENVNPQHTSTLSTLLPDTTPIETDLEKVQSILKQFVRDWSTEGIEERNTCYQPIVDEILFRFPVHEINIARVQVLVPGAGLGRLVFEIARKGYTCQGNEFSLFMLIASNFVLNRCEGINLHQIYPWVHQCDNNLNTEDQLAYILFPDVNPCESIPPNCKFSMVAGDFLEVYRNENEWDCVATCFFIDCANNILSFIEAIYKILKPGGIWINLGPLLYHFSNMAGENSIEPSYEMLKEIINGFGFIYEKEKTGLKSKYAQNPRSMFHCEYESVFFVCRKPHTVEAVSEDDDSWKTPNSIKYDSSNSDSRSSSDEESA